MHLPTGKKSNKTHKRGKTGENITHPTRYTFVLSKFLLNITCKTNRIFPDCEMIPLIAIYS